MRVCIEKTTGKLIESQSGGETHPDPTVNDKEYAQINLDVLVQNAVNIGYKAEEIEAKFITEEEFAVIMEANKPPPTYSDLRRAAYPPVEDYLDAKVKQAHLTNEDIRAEGAAQEKNYLETCLKAKEDNPKPLKGDK